MPPKEPITQESCKHIKECKLEICVFHKGYYDNIKKSGCKYLANCHAKYDGNGYCLDCILTKVENSLDKLTKEYNEAIEEHGAKPDDSVGARLGTVFGSLPYFFAKAGYETYLMFKQGYCPKYDKKPKII
jgi:hypothetical protein